ncbi:MAG: hypothetical protein JWO08_842 [Verrucomicrobiaceae bacterium]|nr:hypothetical protein [Verrucomicrobiaceae bacterium]
MPARSVLLSLLIAGTAFAQQAKPATEPSTGKELAQKKTEAAWDLDADAARKAKMSPDELAWETVLEQNLGSFYLPIHKKEKLAGKSNAWDFVKDDPKLPRVLLIGDSVSRAYTQAVRASLAGKANVHRAPENCGPTKNGLKKLDIWLDGGHWDIIHFNFGIHDRNTPPEEYEKNLRELVTRLKATNAKIIWATTTPTPPNSETYPPGKIEKLNEVAAKVASDNGLIVNDLYNYILPTLAEHQNPNDVHFTAAGYTKLSEKVTQSLEAALAK